ncbi:hypothetical protein FB107DRAFT_280274 [Schizophyllum commune]
MFFVFKRKTVPTYLYSSRKFIASPFTLMRVNDWDISSNIITLIFSALMIMTLSARHPAFGPPS